MFLVCLVTAIPQERWDDLLPQQIRLRDTSDLSCGNGKRYSVSAGTKSRVCQIVGDGGRLHHFPGLSFEEA